MKTDFATAVHLLCVCHVKIVIRVIDRLCACQIKRLTLAVDSQRANFDFVLKKDSFNLIDTLVLE